jgi:hypothetical protein
MANSVAGSNYFSLKRLRQKRFLVQQLLSPGSTALPFFISTEAQRSGEICGFSFPVLTQG